MLLASSCIFKDVVQKTYDNDTNQLLDKKSLEGQAIDTAPCENVLVVERVNVGIPDSDV